VDLTRWAIKNNRVTSVALVVVLLAGIAAYGRLPRSEDPGFTIRIAMIMTIFPGASPERVEQLITDKIEKAVLEMPEVDFVRSQSKTGASIIFVHVQARYDEMRPIWDRLRRKVERASRDLPQDAFPPVLNDEFGDVFGTIATVTGEGYSYRELKQIADEVKNELLLIDEVAKVEIHGDQAEQIFVEFNNARLAELGISPHQLKQVLESRNIIIPGGHVSTDRERMSLEPTGNFDSIDELEHTVIAHPNMRGVLELGDIADVRRAYVDPAKSMVRASGTAALALAINLREGGNITELGRKVRAKINRLQAQYPIGVDLEFAAFQADHVNRKVDDFTTNLLQAVGLVLLVMLVTLGLRTGLVVASLIPMTMVMSLLVMSLLEIGLDQMSLASLIIALGMLVDNAIVMSESIMVAIERGEDAIESAVRSAKELRVPLLTSSLTTSAAFLPIFLAESDVGEYTAPLFKVVTIALLSSWVLSLTMTPLLCVQFLRAKPGGVEEETFGGRFYRVYRGFVIMLLRHRVLTLLVTLGIFALTLSGFRYIPNIFFPPNDKAILTAELRLPIGTPIERTDLVVAAVEAHMASELQVGSSREHGVVDWASFIGRGAPRFVLNYTPPMSSPEYAMLLINATDRGVLPEIKRSLEGFVFERFPDLRVNVSKLPIGPPASAPVEVRVSGQQLDRVFDIATEVQSKLETMSGVENVRNDWGPRTKKILVQIDQDRARRAGLSNLDIAVSLQTVLSGYDTTQFREGDNVIPITLRTVAADREDIGKLESHNVYSLVTGRSVPLKQVADIEVAWQPAKILRRGRLKTVTVSGHVADGVSPLAVSGAMGEWLGEVSDSWGVGYKWALGGEEEKSGAANASIAAKLPIAAFIILMLLVGQFNSIRRPAIILTTIPLGLIGVVAGLLVARSYFGFMTLLGVISLAGIVINNAIVLLDRIRIEIEENGLDPTDALVEAAQRRLRPILLTTTTTIGGLVPLWLGGGPMWEPMAISIIFGLAFSTLLTLGVVPVLYAVLFGVRFDGYRYQEARGA